MVEATKHRIRGDLLAASEPFPTTFEVRATADGLRREWP